MLRSANRWKYGQTASRLKFVTARYVPNDEVSVKTIFIGVTSSDKGGAGGLLDALCSSIEMVTPKQGTQVEGNRSDGNDNLVDKIVGITTDGESANTGKKGGLWQLLQNKLQRNLITVWCVFDRSDLAIESVQSSFPELKHWMSDVIAVSTFFQASARRTKELHKVSILYQCFI